MREQLKKAIALAKKTKSSVIMFDAENPQDTFVLVDLDQYEKMIEKKNEKVNVIKEKNDLTEDNLADKINREISLWKNQENSDSIGSEEDNKNRWKIPPHVKNKAKEIQ